MLKTAFGTTLLRLRKAARKSRAQIARETGLNYRFIQHLESGNFQPTLSTIVLLAAALEVTPDQLIMPAWEAWNEAGQPDLNGQDE